MAGLSVTCTVQSSLAMHRMSTTYGDTIAGDLHVPPISESPWRDRVKKSATHLERLHRSFFNSFLRASSRQNVRAETMMTKARGPLWHQQQQPQGSLPDGGTGLARDATWRDSHAEGWVYGPGTCCLVSQQTPGLGLFQWMPHWAHEAKRLQAESVQFTGVVKTVCLESKADEQQLDDRLTRHHRMPRLPTPRRGMETSPARQQMIRERQTPPPRNTDKPRATTVAPLQGLVKARFERATCWMRGDDSQRWLFAARGVAVQIAQRRAYRRGTSTWNIKEEVIGV
jgi:hypothetical protein